MDGQIVTQLMVSHRLLNEQIVMNTSNDYQKNCIILQQARLMDIQTLVSFSELLLTNDSQKHIGTILNDGE